MSDRIRISPQRCKPVHKKVLFVVIPVRETFLRAGPLNPVRILQTEDFCRRTEESDSFYRIPHTSFVIRNQQKHSFSARVRMNFSRSVSPKQPF
jgi:hypothetical protein